MAIVGFNDIRKEMLCPDLMISGKNWLCPDLMRSGIKGFEIYLIILK